MIYVRSFLTGLATLIGVVILCVAVFLGLQALKTPTDQGGISYVMFDFRPWPTFALALLVFTAGFYWQYRRARKQLHKA